MGVRKGKKPPTSSTVLEPRKYLLATSAPGSFGDAEFLEWYEKRYREGEQLALIECVIFCFFRPNVPLPKWALENLARGFQRYLDGEKLERSLFGTTTKGGRHANPRTAKAEAASLRRVYAAVIFAEREGYRSLKRFEVAADALEYLREKRDLETIQKIYYARKRADRKTWKVLSDGSRTLLSMFDLPLSLDAFMLLMDLSALYDARDDGRIKLPKRHR